MSWRDEFTDTGRFRGVAFFVRSHNAEGGRRLARNEYPFRDVPSVQDLGRKGRTYSLDLYVIGENYHEQRDALEAALDAAGAGELVHPWRGTMRVNVETWRLEETTERGGTAKFSVTFLEGGELSEPRAVRDTRAATQQSGDALYAAAGQQLTAGHQVTGQPQWAFTRIGENITSISDKLRGKWDALLSKVRSPLDLAEQSFGQAQAFAAQAKSGFGLAALVDRIRAAGDLFSPDPSSTPTGAKLARSQAAIARTVRLALMTAVARQAATIDYTSQLEARAVRRAFNELVSAEIERVDAEGNPVNGELYARMIDLRTAVIRDLDSRGMRLPEVTTYTPAATVPALVIAQRLYGDATRVNEIIARNALRDPGFVPGGTPLEVLAR